MSIQNIGNIPEDSFEEKISDEETLRDNFTEIGDDNLTSPNRLTGLMRRTIEKIPLKDYSLLPKLKKYGSRGNSPSNQFRNSPINQFRNSPISHSPIGRFSDNTSHEDYVKAALQAARHRSFSTLSELDFGSLGAEMSDITCLL